MTEAPRYRFTIRQRQVLRLVGDGMKNEAIATELGISPRTVEAHIAALALRIGYSHLPARSALLQFHYETKKGAA